MQGNVTSAVQGHALPGELEFAGKPLPADARQTEQTKRDFPVDTPAPTGQNGRRLSAGNAAVGVSGPSSPSAAAAVNSSGEERFGLRHAAHDLREGSGALTWRLSARSRADSL